MTRSEIFYGDHNSEALAAEALVTKKSEAERGYVLSPKAALGKVLARMGREIVQKTLAPVSGNRSVAEDINALLESLDSDGRKKFLLGLGGICLGVVVQTLEKAAFDGWEDKVFLDNFELAINGTQIPKHRLDNLVERVRGPRRTSQEETANIRQQLTRDKTFLSFFDLENPHNLPQIVEVIIYKFSPYPRAMERVLPVYEGAVKYL
ncbi:MAG: hypothetical protein Q8P89_04790 [bacterium]|nr:hypothetical protein [bacterium]